MLVKFEQNRMVQTTQNLSFLTQKTPQKRVFKTIFDKAFTPSEDVSVAEIIVYR